MNKTIHPSTVIAQFKLFIFAIIISLIAYFIRNLAAGYLILTLAVIWGFAILIGILIYIKSRFITLEISDKDLLFRKGIFRMKTVLVPYSKVVDTRFSQTLLERIFGIGTLEIETPSEFEVAIIMNGVRHDDVKDIMQNVRDK